jgi:hypothetical protein
MDLPTFSLTERNWRGVLARVKEAEARLFELPAADAELPSTPGMSWALETSAAVGHRVVDGSGERP